MSNHTAWARRNADFRSFFSHWRSDSFRIIFFPLTVKGALCEITVNIIKGFWEKLLEIFNTILPSERKSSSKVNLISENIFKKLRRWRDSIPHSPEGNFFLISSHNFLSWRKTAVSNTFKSLSLCSLKPLFLQWWEPLQTPLPFPSLGWGEIPFPARIPFPLAWLYTQCSVNPDHLHWVVTGLFTEVMMISSMRSALLSNSHICRQVQWYKGKLAFAIVQFLQFLCFGSVLIKFCENHCLPESH